MSVETAFSASATATIVVCLCCFGACPAGASSVNLDSSLLGISLQHIQARSPYKYVREVILAAEGETRAITCSFDSLYTTGKHWKRTFYTPVVWFAYSPNASSKPQPAREEPITDGTVLRFDGGGLFAYKLLNPMSAAPSSILVLENVPAQLSDTYFICRTSLHPASVQAFYLRVVKPVLFTPGAPSSSGGRVPVQLGGRLSMDCSTGSNFPPASVHWSRRLEDERPSARPPVLAWGPVYEVSNVSMETAQFIFTCHVNNQLDAEWTASFRVDLINATKQRPGPVSATYNGVRPAFRSGNRRAVPRDGESFTLACRARGEGIVFTWLRNGTRLRPFADPNLYTYSSSIAPEHIADLIIRRFRPSDRGLYQCVARNEAGRSGFVFDLMDASTTSGRPPSQSQPTPGLPEGVGVDGGRPPPEQHPQQQHLGSGWGVGSGDDELDEPVSDSDFSLTSSTAGGSGDRRPAVPLTASPGGRRIRRHHWKTKRLLP